MKLLLVEDSDRLRETLSRGLEAAGFTVDSADDGARALEFLASYEYDLVVLDLTLPRVDGLAVLRELPRGGQRPRVIVLSARDTVSDRIGALDAGADDYLVKPFSFDELLARLYALARRPGEAQPEVIELGSLVIHTRAHEVRVAGTHLPLTPREYATLLLLARNRGRAFSRVDILERTAGSDTGVSDRSVEVLIFGLRRKLAAVELPMLIETRRGAGYIIS